MKAQVSNLDDPDMQRVPEVLKRAAEKAKRLAEETGTPFIVRESITSTDSLRKADSASKQASDKTKHPRAE